MMTMSASYSRIIDPNWIISTAFVCFLDFYQMKKALALSQEAEATHMTIKKDTHLTILKEKFLSPDKDWATILQTAGFNFIVRCAF